MRKLILIGLISSALSGCAIGYHAINGSLGEVFPIIASASAVPIGTLGDGTGYQATTLNINIPAGICDRTAFIDGFKDDYVTNWNQFVHTKINLFHAQLGNKPGNKSAKTHNLALYKSRLIGTKGYTGNGAKYIPPVEKSYKGDYCPSNAYMQGRNAGMEIVARERKILSDQEL